jgi:hypothetical protein
MTETGGADREIRLRPCTIRLMLRLYKSAVVCMMVDSPLTKKNPQGAERDLRSEIRLCPKTMWS